MKRRDRFLITYIYRVTQKLGFFIQTNYNRQKIHCSYIKGESALQDSDTLVLQTVLPYSERYSGPH